MYICISDLISLKYRMSTANHVAFIGNDRALSTNGLETIGNLFLRYEFIFNAKSKSPELRFRLSQMRFDES